MSAQKESQEPTEKYCLGSDVKDGLRYREESKVYPNHIECQRDHTEDPASLKEAIFDLKSTTRKAISQTVAVAQEDKTLFIPAIIQALGLNETKGEFLKYIITSYVNYSKPYGAGNVIGALPARDSSRQPIRKYNNNHVGVRNLLTDFQKVVGHANSSGDSVHLLDHLPCALQEENYNQCFINFHPLQQLLVATDGEGDSDPEYTKLPINSTYHGGSDLPAGLIAYVQSKTSEENIHIRVQTKEDYSQNFAKAIKPSIDKLSWREKCEESNIDVEVSEEEGDHEPLASPYLLYGQEEMDDMVDQSSIYSLDNCIQHTKQAGDTGENQNNEDDDSNSTGDSVGEVADNDGGGIPLEGNPAPPVEVPDVGGESDIIKMETTPYGGNHELVGKDPTIQTSDYTADQSQLAGSKSCHSIQSQAPATKHHLLIGHGYGINVPVDGSLENATVSNLSQDSNYNNEVEQAQESLPLADPMLEPIISPPKLLHNNNSFYPFQPEDPFMPLCNEVDPPTETDSSIEDASSEISYVDAVEVNEDSCHHCSLSHHSVSPFVSPAAENVDNQSEEVSIEPPPKYGWWRDCRLL